MPKRFDLLSLAKGAWLAGLRAHPVAYRRGGASVGAGRWNLFAGHASEWAARLLAAEGPARLGLERLEAREMPAAVPIQFFYVPEPEQPTLAALEAIGSGSQGTTATSFITITTVENGTVLYYDQWEDGYEPDLAHPQQASTLVWGDGNDANGIAPGFAHDPTGIPAGTVLKLRNDVPAAPRDPSQVYFDGSDKIGASNTVSISRAQFPVTGGSVIASSVEVRDTRYFDTSYTAPVGTDTPNAGSMYNYSQLFVMAAQDNTHVRIDVNHNGVFTDPGDVDVVLNQGQNVVSGANVLQGARVIADKPVQTVLLTGQINSSYQSRSYNLFPDSQLANDWFTPVGNTGDPVWLYAYNPNSTAITVNYETRTASGTLGSIAPGATARFVVPTDTGTRLFTPGGEVFAAASAHDAPNVTHDWGFDLQPVSALSQFAVVGLGVGNSHNPPAGSGSTSPVWVTPLAATTVYVDLDGDPTTGANIDPVTGTHYDQSYTLARLQSLRLTDPSDDDASGMRIFTTDGTLISTTWGEDTVAPSGDPGFDAGTTVPALPVPEFYKLVDFAPGGDVNGDGYFNSGDRLRYTLRVRNIGTEPISNALISDLLPSYVTYVPGTAFIDQGSGATAIADGGSTAFPFDEGGYNIVNMSRGSTTLVTFDVTINSALPAGTTTITNGAHLAYSFYNLPATNTAPVRGTVGDFVWNDLNGDGVQDPGEPGLANVTVNLIWAGPDGDFTTTGDNVTYTTMTDATGKYRFANLPEGNFRVSVVTPQSNLTPTFDLDGINTANTADFTLLPGQNRTDLDFGYVGTASVGDFVWNDRNGNRIQDAGEPGLAGVAVRLTVPGADNTLGTADDLVYTTTTAADGSYLFAGLPIFGAAGTANYRIDLTGPVTAFTPTADPDGANTPNTATFAVASTGPNANRRDIDFGYTSAGALSGTVFRDDNNNGVQTAGEPGIPGVVVTLTGVDVFGNPVVDPATGQPYRAVTDANGNYSFTNLPPGTYTLTETQPAAYVDGIDTAGTLGGSAANDVIRGIVIGATTSGTGYTFAEQGVSLAGRVFRDDDRGGTQNGTEPGIAGVTVMLTSAGADGVLGTGDDVPVGTRISNASGDYEFDDLPAGPYRATESQPAGYADTPAGAFQPNTRDVSVPLAGLTGQNFGDVLGSVSGTVYLDTDNSGTRGAGEAGIPNVSVTIAGNDVNGNAVSRTVYTDAQGRYTFAALLPPQTTYTITEGSAAPYIDRAANVGTGLTTPGTASGPNGFTGVAFTAGQQGVNYDFGETQPAAPFIAGSVFRDDNRDGSRQTGEPGVAGVTVALYNAGPDGVLGNSDDPAPVTTTTDADGNYRFTGLTAGSSYQVVETQPGTYGNSPVGPRVVIAVPSLPAAGSSGNNFGETLGSLTGTVYFDRNNSGALDAGEPGLAGITVALTGTDVNGNAVNLTTTADANGTYTFTNVPAGTYQVSEPTQPANYRDGPETAGSEGGVVGGANSDTISGVRVGGGVNATGYNFGELGQSVSGTVFYDRNRDGAISTGEPGIGGVRIELIDAAGNVVDATATDASGNYSFPNVAPGSYTVREVQPSGYGDPASGPFAPNTRSVTVAAAAITGQSFGDTLSTLSGSVYVDANNDGIRQGGEAGIANVPVALDWAGADGVFGTADDVTALQKTTTDASGNYTFADLRTGNYRVREVTQPAAYADGKDTAGPAGGVTAINDQIGNIPVGTGSDLTGYIFGEQPPATTTITGAVYVDSNNNGVRDPGEPGVGGVAVTLSGGPGSGPVTTDADGNYTFTGLTPGANYTITETQPAAYANGTQNAGNVITLTNLPAAGVTGNDFGERGGLVSGSVYVDANNDGARQSGEAGIANVPVTLTGTDVTGVAVSRTTTTDANGNYTFTDLPASTTGYTVREAIQPAGYNDGTDTAGTVNGTPTGTAGNDVITGVALPAGGTGAAYVFGELLPASTGATTVSGRVFLDANRDGVAGPGEPALGGITLRLLDPAGRVVATTTTAADGRYTFINVLPGTYSVVETQPTGYGSSTPDSVPVTVPRNLTPVAGIDFGDTLSTLSGSVYIDANGNATRDAGEAGIGGVRVTLTGAGADNTFGTADDLTFATTTDANGDYTFANLPAGLYRVTEPTQPVPYPDGTDTAGTAGGNAGNDVIDAVPLAAGTIATGYLFGELPPAGPFIAGSVYLDTDDNGLRSPGEPGVAGVTVTLTGAGADGVFGNGDDPAPVPVTTGPDGRYSFPNLIAGQNYRVTETQPTAYGNGVENPGNVVTLTNLPASGAGGQNFGERGGSIRGTVYADADGNGSFNPAVDAGVPNATVALISAGPDNTFNTGDDVSFGTTTTDAFGNYLFANLPVGTYRVTETQPAGYTQGTNTVGTVNGAPSGALGPVVDQISGVAVSPAASGVGYNFGEVRPAVVSTTVAGAVYIDANGNAARDAGEAGLTGVTVQLLDGGGTVVATTTTAPDGSYLFNNVPPGTYSVVETQPAGYGSSTPDTTPVTVAGTPIAGVNFGDTLGRIAGSVYVDANGNGTRDAGEAGVSGVIVTLSGTDADGRPVNLSAVTDASGNYSFTGLGAGTYMLTEVQPAGFPDGLDAAGTVNGTPSGTAGNDLVTGIVLPGGGAGAGYLFGERAPLSNLGTTTVSGTVYADSNANGTLNPGEAGLAGVTLQLLNSGGTVVATAITGPDGAYTFNNIPPGTYTVVEAQPAGYGSSTPNSVSVTVPTSLAPVTGVAFGETTGSVSGSVYLDLNNSGIREAGEPGVGGVTVTLAGTDATGAAVNRSTTTDGSGNYTFGGLLASNGAGYTVSEPTQPGGLPDGTDAAGTVNGTPTGTAGNDTITGIVLPAAGTAAGYTFGERLPATNPGTATVSGTVWRDTDGNGRVDPGEPGLAGVTVQLLDPSGTVVATTTSGAGGSYVFTNVAPGNYTVHEVQPAAFGSSTPNDVPVSVPATAAPVAGINFGEASGSLRGSVFNDINANGVRDPGEPGIPVVAVTLAGTDVNGNGVNRTAVTDADGNYLFTDLPAGTYAVTETQPTAYADGRTAVGSAGGVVGTNVTSAVPVGAGEAVSGYTFGEGGPNSIAGSVYLDLDLTGTRTAGDSGIAGVVVVLTGTDTAGNVVARSAVTDANGGYRFDDLPAGTYTVTERQDTLPTTATPANGIYDGADNVGTVGGVARGSSPAKNQLRLTLAGGSGAAGEPAVGYDFGELPPADPFGYVYTDLNGNGTLDAGEPGIAGVAITISGVAFDGTPFARALTPGDVPGGSLTVFTDANGRYQFNPIPPGLYTISEAQPAGYLDGAEQNGDPSAPAPAVGNDVFSNLRLAPLPVRGPFNFGELLAGRTAPPTVPPTVPPPPATTPPTLVPVTPVTPPAPQIDKSLFLSSSAAANMRTSPTFANSVAALGVASPVRSIGVAVGADAGQPAIARLYDYRTGTQRLAIDAFPGFTGGVRVATGDVNGDGIDDLIVAAGPGAGPHVKVFDGATGGLLLSFMAYDPAYRGGVNVAVGDVNRDGFADIITSAGPGVGPHVKVFDGRTGAEVRSFMAYDPAYLGGVSVAVGDVNGDGYADIVTGAGAGTAPHVKVFDGLTGSTLQSFLAFAPTYLGGVNVAVADTNGDGVGEVVATAATGSSSHVVVQEVGGAGRQLASFLAWPGYYGNGLRVAAADVNGDGASDLILGSGPGGATRVTIVDGRTGRMIDDFFAFNPYGPGGVTVG